MAFLLASSRSAGIDEYAVSIAMSFASAKLTFINCNSSSILSKVRSDKTFSESVMACDRRRQARPMQRRSHHICVSPVKYASAYVCFHLKRTLSVTQLTVAFRPEAVARTPDAAQFTWLVRSQIYCTYRESRLSPAAISHRRTRRTHGARSPFSASNSDPYRGDP